MKNQHRKVYFYGVVIALTCVKLRRCNGLC